MCVSTVEYIRVFVSLLLTFSLSHSLVEHVLLFKLYLHWHFYRRILYIWCIQNDVSWKVILALEWNAWIGLCLCIPFIDVTLMLRAIFSFSSLFFFLFPINEKINRSDAAIHRYSSPPFWDHIGWRNVIGSVDRIEVWPMKTRNNNSNVTSVAYTISAIRNARTPQMHCVICPRVKPRLCTFD